MKVEFNHFVVKIKAQYKTEKENRTEKFLYHLLGVYADARKTAIREGKFTISQAYSKEIEGIKNAFRQAEAAREEAEEKRRGVGFKIGDKVIIPQDVREELEGWEWFKSFEKQFPEKEVYEISAKVGKSYYNIEGDEHDFIFRGDQLKAYDESEKLIGKKIWVEEKSSSWHTETPTEDGDYLVKMDVEHNVYPYYVLKWNKKGWYSHYDMDYPACPQRSVLKWQKIEDEEAST